LLEFFQLGESVIEAFGSEKNGGLLEFAQAVLWGQSNGIVQSL
jgi:hypothetical protein